MRYYIKYGVDGEIQGYMKYPGTNETMTEVTKDEYYRIRAENGIEDPLETPVQTAEERIVQLEQDKAVMSAQLQAAIQSNSFLEECIVEMAGIVYA